MSRRTVKRRGGEILGEGNFSKVIHPAIPCADGRNMDNLVSRISKTKDFKEILSKDYPKLIKKLKKIDPTQKYFIYPEYCKPGSLTESNKTDGITDDMKKYSEIMPLGGITYRKKFNVTLRRRTWLELFKRKKIIIDQSNKIDEETMEYLKKALALLHKHRISHNDLHPDNIIFVKDGTPRIIDFGLATEHASNEFMNRDLFNLKNIFYNGKLPSSLASV
jgi:serine/threonine protein kinase